MYLDISTLLADYARVDITVGGTGPSFTKSFLFSKIEAGSQGPGILYIGEFSDIITATPTRPLNNNGNARDVVSVGNDYYAYIGVEGATVTAAAIPPSSNWEPFTYFSAIATGMLITENSYVKETITVGTNAGASSANITIYGGGIAPYISVGQVVKAFDSTGIFLGIDSGVAKLSLKGDDGSLSWNGTALAIVGNITATSGAIGL